MDRIAQGLAQQNWAYAEQDPLAFAEIARRVADVGRREQLITYTDLVSGIDFHLPRVNGGEGLRLGVPDWSENLHRAILGDFLGRLCLDTYLAGQFMGSAIVVANETRQPSEGYRQLMRTVGVLRSNGDAEFLSHWIPETRKAYAWYASHP
jgi:hypothetical protein